MNRLKSLRESRRMKQSELGKILNVQDAAISKYESGKVQLTGDTLIELSKLFNVSIDYILRNDKFCVEYANKKEQEQKTPFNTNEIERNLLEIYRNYKDNGFSDNVSNELKSFFPELNANSLKTLSEREKTVLDVFRKLNEDNQDIIVGDMKKYLKEQRYEESVAADKQLKNLK